MNILLAEVYAKFGMTRTEFAKHSNIPYKTLEGWEIKGCSSLGEILLNSFLKHKEELEQYKDKAQRFDAIQRALLPKDLFNEK